MQKFLHKLLLMRKLLCVWLIPIILLPIPLSIETNAGKCAYVVLLMALFWLTEALPLAVTSLIPMVLLPLMGILSTDQTCKSYMSGSIMIFLGSLISAAAVENSGLHQRIALKVLLLFGTSPKWLLLGFMINTSFLSMWISNLASTALMIPIVDAVLVQLRHRTRSISSNSGRKLSIISNLDCKETNLKNHYLKSQTVGRRSSCVPYEDPEVDVQSFTRMKKSIYLGICYAANIGGTGTLTGTTPNLILNGMLTENPISFANWMFFNVPGMLICVALAWIFVVMAFLRNSTPSKQNVDEDKAITNLIKKKYELLGPITFHEGVVLLLFLVLLCLWFFRDPDFFTGWGVIINPKPKFIKDATAAILIVILFFMIPANPKQLTTSPMLMNWKTTQEKVSWGVLLLLGGGFAMAKGADVSGLSDWLGDQLAYLQNLPSIALVIVVCLLALIMTEIASNTATCTILLPVIKRMAYSLNISPLSVMLPVTLCCSYAFMLPVASGPNAIVFDAANMKTKDMVIPGIAMKLICAATTILMINTWGYVVLDFSLPSNSSSIHNSETISH